jgi:hypothetical protein
MREQCSDFFYCRGIASQKASPPSQLKTQKEQEPLSPLAAFTPLETGVFVSLALILKKINRRILLSLCLCASMSLSLFSGDGQQQRFLILFRNAFVCKDLGV